MATHPPGASFGRTQKSARSPSTLPLARWPEGWSPVFLVPVDGSQASRAALTVARNLARVMETTLHLVHVTEAPLSETELLRRLGLRKQELRGAVLDSVRGEPREAIVSEARRLRAELIVLGATPSPDQPLHPLGPIAEYVVCSSYAPVLLVRPGACGRLGKKVGKLSRVLLPLSGAPSAAEVITPAVTLAARSGAELDVLHVAGPGVQAPLEPGTFTTPRYIDHPEHEWPAWQREFLDRVCHILGHVPTTVPTRLSVAIGAPAPTILEFARRHRSDLIALEWHCEMDTHHARVVRPVIATAPSPVLLLRVARA